MRKREFLGLIAVLPLPSSCANSPKPETTSELSGWSFVVRHELKIGAKPKYGLEGHTHTGHVIFADGLLDERNPGTSAYGGSRSQSFPKWVRVTWREGMTAYLTGKSGHYETGTVVGEYTIPILERIPDDVFAYVRAQRGRVIRLKFRIHDQGVLFGWDVQDRGKSGREPTRHLMAGGDW